MIVIIIFTSMLIIYNKLNTLVLVNHDKTIINFHYNFNINYMILIVSLHPHRYHRYHSHHQFYNHYLSSLMCQYCVSNHSILD